MAQLARLVSAERLTTAAKKQVTPKLVDPVAFATSVDFIADPWQTRALQWSGRQLLLNCARQSGKSTTTAILALHRAHFYPKSLVLLVSPSLRQSSELFRKVSERLNLLPERPAMIEDNKLSCTLANGSRIVSLPSSEATIRGYSSVNLCIFDEAAYCADSLYLAIRPMLLVSRGALILMSTPRGKRGFFWRAWSEEGDAWQRIEAPATDNPRLTPEDLERERRLLGDWSYKQELLCQFVDSVDGVFTYETVMGAVDDKVQPLFASTKAAKEGDTWADRFILG